MLKRDPKKWLKETRSDFLKIQGKGFLKSVECTSLPADGAAGSFCPLVGHNPSLTLACVEGSLSPPPTRQPLLKVHSSGGSG